MMKMELFQMMPLEANRKSQQQTNLDIIPSFYLAKKITKLVKK